MPLTTPIGRSSFLKNQTNYIAALKELYDSFSFKLNNQYFKITYL